MKRITPYLINKKALQFVMAALLLLGGSRMAWGQATTYFTWHNNDHISGQNNWGIGGNVIITVDDGATVYIDGQIAPMNYAGQYYSVTIKPASASGTCTIMRGSSNTGVVFNVYPTTNPYGSQFGSGVLNIEAGVTINGNGNNITSASPIISIAAGGICNMNGTATNHVKVTNNNGTAAIHNEYGLNCTYTDFSYNTGHANGGAVMNHSAVGQTNMAYAKFDYCTFDHNSGIVGGGIFNTRHIQCNHCQFTNNTGTNTNELGGGAIISDDNGTWTAITELTDCLFESNTAFNGGAILAWGNLECTDCTFKSNSAVNGGSGPGGGIYYGGSQSSSHSCKIDNCTFDSNTAEFKGGALLIYKNRVNYCNCTINNSDFYNNSGGSAGAIAVHDDATVIFNSGRIYDNTANLAASGQGGAVHIVSSGTFTMEGGEIGISGHGNTAVRKGGGVYTAGTFIFNGGSIYYNTADDGNGVGDGGGIYVDGGNFTLGSARSIIKNYAINGGGIYINGGSLIINGTVGGSSANKNTAVNGGGVYVNGGTLHHNGQVTYNDANNGGGIYSSGGGTMNLNSGSVVSYNHASYGAGVYISGGYNNFMLANSNVNDNTGATKGGGFYIYGGMLQMQGGDIHHHSATYGGGVYVDTDGIFYQTSGRVGYSGAANTASKGGGIYTLGNTILSNGQVFCNTVTSGGEGAGVYMEDGSLTMNGFAIIAYNTGATNGGGVYVEDGTFDMSNDNTSIHSHSATNGSGVYLAGGTFNLSGGRIGYNATYYNTASSNGGGVYVNGGTFNMTGGSIVYNQAQNGAGVYINTSTMNYRGAGAIEYNTASTNGGGVYVNNTAAFNMENTKIQLNTAVNGGGVYVNAGGTFTMRGTDTSHSCDVISNNVTSGNGGGVYHKGTTTVTGLIHINNNSGNRASNNTYLDQSGTVKYLYIGEPGLLCGSDIAVKNSTNNMEIARGSGSTSVAVKNAQHAYRNGFFRNDGTLVVSTTNTATPLYNYESKSLYLKTTFGGNSIYALAQNAQAGRDYDGSVGNITAIYTVEGLAFFANDVNVNGNLYANKVVTLEADIVIPSTYDWEPIGYRVECDPKPFKGTFNGKFHTVKNIHSNFGYLDAGFFGYVENGEIKNVLIDEMSNISAFEGLGGVVGYMTEGNIINCEARVTLPCRTTTATSNCYTGGIAGKTEGQSRVVSCYAITTITGNGNSAGLVGYNGNYLVNSWVRTTTAKAAFTCYNNRVTENCYVIGMSTLANAGINADYCYSDRGTASGRNGVFGTTDLTNAGKYGFAHQDQQITANNSLNPFVVNGGLSNTGELGGLLTTLNHWIGTNNYTRWARTMGADINGDYPVLMFDDAVCLGSQDGIFIDYAYDLNPMIADYNNATNGGDIYLYAVPSTINVNTASNVRVYINEKVGVLQTTGNRVNARVGVTVDNSSTGFMAYDWHMFSSSLTAANMGLEYHSGVGDSYYVKNNYSTLLANGIPTSVYDSPANMDPTKTTWSTTNAGYFPTNTPYGTWRGTADSNGSFDFYCYAEPYAHWINFKREGVASFYDHWHMDADANGMHQNIPYLNETTMTPGKGYMVAISELSMLMTDGVLNNGDAAGNVSTAVTATNLPESESGLKGVNLIGNPYQSYLDFDLFAANSINAAVNSTYYILDADRHGYVSYTVGQSDALAPRVLHPHQGFIVRVNSSRNLRFTPSMRATTGQTFRSEDPHYALVNLFCADAQDRRDYTTVELDRPEVGGGEKVMGLHAGDASVWIHYDNADWQTAFTTPGLHEVPVRFKAYKDGFFTMGWETLNGYFSYMHLIDNMTGMDIDCLNAREYHFEGKVGDYTSRFRLVFEYTDVDENDDATAEDQSFAFMMGDELVVNGNGMLQVFDLNGRCVYATELYDVQSTVSLPRLTAGVYILRLTGSQSARTQKMVIK